MSSINVRKVVWTVRELGLAMERTEAGGPFGVVREPDYLRRNPNALVPLLEDGEVTLWESNVIVRYLCARHAAGTLYPEDLPQRFESEKWMDWQQTALNRAGREAFIQWIRTPAAKRDAATIAASVNATEALMAMLDEHLSGQAYMAGDRFTMADIPVGCEIDRWWALPQPRPERPHIERWYQSILAREATRGVLDMPQA